MANQQLRKRSKRPDNRPARTKYWITHRLRDNKVRRMVKSTRRARQSKDRLSLREAQDLWEEIRKGRMRN